MLVLSRKNQEAVVVGGTNGFEHILKVTVLDIRSGSVKLGFEIDAGVPVHRWEVWQRIALGMAQGSAEDSTPCDKVMQRTPKNDG